MLVLIVKIPKPNVMVLIVLLILLNQSGLVLILKRNILENVVFVEEKKADQGSVGATGPGKVYKNVLSRIFVSFAERL